MGFSSLPSPQNWANSPQNGTFWLYAVITSSCQLEKQHVTAPLAIHLCLSQAGGKAVPTKTLGKHHLEYVWPLPCKTRRKKEQR